MALQVYSTVPRTSLVQHSVPQGIMSNHATVVCVAGDYSHLMKRKRGISVGLRVKASSDSAAAVVVEVGRVTEVTKDTFWPIVNAAGDKTVVLDMYTQCGDPKTLEAHQYFDRPSLEQCTLRCGPCKAMAPKFQLLSEKYDDVVFLKMDCNDENRPLVKELGLKVVPTFKILKDSKIINVVTGAKLENLVDAIEKARST